VEALFTSALALQPPWVVDDIKRQPKEVIEQVLPHRRVHAEEGADQRGQR